MFIGESVLRQTLGSLNSSRPLKYDHSYELSYNMHADHSLKEVQMPVSMQDVNIDLLRKQQL